MKNLFYAKILGICFVFLSCLFLAYAVPEMSIVAFLIATFVTYFISSIPVPQDHCQYCECFEEPCDEEEEEDEDEDYCSDCYMVEEECVCNPQYDEGDLCEECALPYEDCYCVDDEDNEEEE